MPTIVRSIADLRAAVAAIRASGETLALVPTMGALHTGHLALVRHAKTLATRALASIFVNPTQFAPNEDLSRYPRDEAGDVAKLETAGTDLVWIPPVSEMYPEGFATRVRPAGVALGLEGAARPSHFEGVATVCCKLFSAVTPDVAVFGEKDYQQLCVIRQMVRDLNLPLEIAGLPTVREPDGLALSSRNAYLSAAERRIAPALHRTLKDAARQVARGESAARAEDAAIAELKRAGFAKIDYVAVADAATLNPLDRSADRRPARILAAAWLGRTRLIDNVPA